MTQHESFQPRQPSRQPPFDDPGYPPRHRVPQPPAGVPGPPPSRDQRVTDADDVPPWAGLGPEGAPPPPSRGETSAARRKRRRMIEIGAAAGVVVLAVGGYLIFGGSSGPANVTPGDLVTSFLPGELQSVPDACTAVPAATLQQFLPGQTRQAAPPLNVGRNSQCTWTLDNAPMYREIEVDIQAYIPSAMASGDGSATFAAIDAYLAAQSDKQNPGKGSGAPKAQLTTLRHLGDDAFSATQVFTSDDTVSDLVTEVIRYHNVLVTVVVNGLDKSNKGGKHYGPVSMTDLANAAQAVAQSALARVH